MTLVIFFVAACLASGVSFAVTAPRRFWAKAPAARWLTHPISYYVAALLCLLTMVSALMLSRQSPLILITAGVYGVQAIILLVSARLSL